LILSDKGEVVVLDDFSESASQSKGEEKADDYPVTGTGM